MCIRDSWKIASCNVIFCARRCLLRSARPSSFTTASLEPDKTQKQTRQQLQLWTSCICMRRSQSSQLPCVDLPASDTVPSLALLRIIHRPWSQIIGVNRVCGSSEPWNQADRKLNDTLCRNNPSPGPSPRIGHNFCWMAKPIKNVNGRVSVV